MSQAGTFLNQPEIQDISNTQIDSDKPLVPFSSALKLTREQEAKLVNHALRRIDQMEDEQGRVLVSASQDWYRTSTNILMDRYTFMGKRSIYELTHNQRLGWRRYAVGGIFTLSNLHAPFTRGIARQITAQSIDYFFGTDPWFAAYPVGGDEEDLAEELDEFCQFATGKNELKSCMSRAIEGATVRGESVVKTTYETVQQTYEQLANVLIDPDGKDILDANGDWITDKDKFVDEKQSEVDPQTGKPIPGSEQFTGCRVLKKDMVTPEPPELNYESKTIRRRSVSFQGAKSDVVFWQDFLCPQNASSVQRDGADICVHLSDMPTMTLIDLYVRRGLIGSAQEDYEATARAIKLLQANLAYAAPSSAVKQPRAAIGETEFLNNGDQNVEPRLTIAECYLTYDANEDGQTEEILLVLDRKNKLPIFYDYLANVTPDSERPFDVVRIQPVESRWWGQGVYETYEKTQRAIDLFLNRWNLSQSQAGRVTFWKASNTLEGDRNPNLPLNYGQTYTLLKDKTAEETLSFVNLPEIKGEDLQKIMQLLVQIQTSDSGTSSANDAAIAGLDTSQLATGVKNIQAHNDIKINMYLSNMLPTLTSITRRNLKVEIANMQPVEIFSLFHGDKQKTSQLLQEDAQDLDFDVTITLSRYKNQALLASAMGAQNAFAQFMQLPVPAQHLGAPLYIQSLKAYGISDANSIIVPLDEQLPQSAEGPLPPTQGPSQAHAPGQPEAPQGQPGAPQGFPTPSVPISTAQPIQANKPLWNKPTKGS